MKSWLVLLGMVAICVAGCKADFCETVVCENGGSCQGGFCNCPDGFTGARCEIPLDPCLLSPCAAPGTDTCLVSPVTGEARCICATGYEGERCADRWEAKFAGNFNAAEDCGSLVGNFPMAVQAGPDPGQVTLVNFANQQPGSIPAKVVGNLVNSKVFQIYTQYMAFGQVSGQGSYRLDGAIEFSYQLIHNGDTSECTTLLIRQ